MFLFTFSHSGLLNSESLFLCVCACVFVGASSCMTSLRKCVPPDTRTPRSKAWIMCLSLAQLKTVKEHQKSTKGLVISTSFHFETSLPAASPSLFCSLYLSLRLHLLGGIPTLNACPLGEARMVQASYNSAWQGDCANQQTMRGTLHNSDTNTHTHTHNCLHKWPWSLITFPQKIFQCHTILLLSGKCQYSPPKLPNHLQYFILMGQRGGSAMN